MNGFVDLETGIKLEALLEALGTPRSHTANGGTPDTRTTTERHGDALAEAIQLAVTSTELPTSGGEPFTILLTAPETTLNQQHGGSSGHSSEPGTRDSEHGSSDSAGDHERDARTADLTATAMDGTRIPTAQLRRIACDATVITKHGRHKRTAPPALRRPLIARDQGCAHPDCSAPPSRTQAHHIQHHAHHGRTVLDNMVLLCSNHHALIHHTQWTVDMEHGRPRFTPPGYRDIPNRPPLDRAA